MANIKEIIGKEILDSRGNPTISVTVTLESGIFGEASVPSGASTGKYEALELRDGDLKKYNGLGVTKAINNLEKISEVLKGQNCTNQMDIDKKMISLDGSKNKGNLGANAILGVSLAVSRAAANSLRMPLYKYLQNIYESGGNWQENFKKNDSFQIPKAFFNILNGGKHADNNVDIQETMVVPNLGNFKKNLEAASEIYHTLQKILHEKGLNGGVGDEGGFAPNLENNVMIIELILEAIERAGYRPKEEVSIALDVAASELFREGKYVFKKDTTVLTSNQLSGLISDWVKEYPIISIEDPLAEDDWDGWKEFTGKAKNLQIVGDDLFVTNNERLKKGIEMGAGNAVLIKPNQIGTLTETLETIRLAKENNYGIMISHRSGETTDTFISDLAVATNAGQIKAGAPARGERIAKYNRLLEIEEELKNGK